MTPNQAKKHLAEKLKSRNIQFQKLTARTVDFSDLARAKPVFVKIHGATFQPGEFAAIKSEIPKPSDGGYLIET